MPVLLGEILPSFPGSERGKLALSWELGARKEPEAPEQGGRWLVRSGILRALSASWELQLVVAVLVMGLAVGAIPAGAGES